MNGPTPHVGALRELLNIMATTHLKPTSRCLGSPPMNVTNVYTAVCPEWVWGTGPGGLPRENFP